MMEILRSPEVIVALCGGMIGAIIWNIRLEGKQILHKALFTAQLGTIEKEHTALKAQVETEVIKREVLEKSIRDDLNEIKLTLARMEEKLKN
jgi:hypothetical protein